MDARSFGTGSSVSHLAEDPQSRFKTISPGKSPSANPELLGQQRYNSLTERHTLVGGYNGYPPETVTDSFIERGGDVVMH